MRALPAMASPGRSWPWLPIALVAVALAGVLAGPWAVRAARAHAELVAAEPGFNEEVTEVDVVRLEFGEPLVVDERNRVWIIDAADNEVTVGESRLVGDRYVLEADVAADLPRGEYFVRYRALAVDGDLQEGGHLFRVVAPPGQGGAWFLLGIGVVAMALVVWLLRPRGARS